MAYSKSIAIFVCVICSAGVFACSKSKSSDKKSNEPIVSQARTGGFQPYAPRDVSSVTQEFTPGEDASIAVWKTKILMPGLAFDKPALMTLTSPVNRLVQTTDLQFVSPLVNFTLTNDEGVISRELISRVLTINNIVDRYVEAKETVVLLVLNYGQDTEKRYAVAPEDLDVVIEEDGSRTVSFVSKETDFAVVVAVSRDGRIPSGYERYIVVPKDSSGLVGNQISVSDLPTELTLTWTPAEGSRSGYKLEIAYEEIKTIGCQSGSVIDNALIEKTREKFPKFFLDTYLATGIDDGKKIYLQLCSINSREPPDVSEGITASYDLPDRATAVLSDLPPELTNSQPISVTVGGDLVVSYKYALVSWSDACESATYSSSWIPVATKITQVPTEGLRKLCVLGKIAENNIQRVATEHKWELDLTPPGAFSIQAFVTPTNNPTPSVTVDASIDAAQYEYVLSTTGACDAPVSTGNSVNTTYTFPTIAASGTYYICVKSFDLATNSRVATNTAQSIYIDFEPPVFTSVDLANDASDTYINLVESVATNDLLDNLNASGYDASFYVLVPDGTLCDENLTYDTMPSSNDAVFVADGDYKVCVKLTEVSGNITYGESSTIHRDTVPPVFTSVDLANDVLDLVLISTERSLANALTGNLVGTGYDLVSYSAQLTGVTCDENLTYISTANSNSPQFGADGIYKICVRIYDFANNPDFGETITFELDTTSPIFTSLSLANEVVDTYINIAESSSSNDIVQSLVAVDFDTVGYKLVTNGTTCNGALTYSASFPTINSPDFGSQGVYKVCVKLVDVNLNPPTYANSPVFTFDTVAPSFTSISLINTAADGYINLAERSTTSNLVGSIVGAGYNTATYKLVSSLTVCDGNLTYGTVPKGNSADFGVDDFYKVCVLLRDNAGNPDAFGSSSVFELETVLPVFTSVDLLNEATDTVLNMADLLIPNDLAGNVVASGHISTTYAFVASASACSGATYGAMPTNTGVSAQADGVYKVCVRIADIANNAVFGNSILVTLDNTPPTPTLNLINDAADGYLNGSEVVATNDLAGGLGGAVSANYKLKLAADTCNNSFAYDVAMPKSNSGDFAGDNTYKICIEALDAAGNTGYGSSSSIIRDTVDPAATNVDSTLANGSYGPGIAVNVRITFNETIAFSGSTGDITYKLETGATDQTASYQSGNNSTVIDFEYTVQAGDTASPLSGFATAPHFAFTGDKRLKDLAGNVINLDASVATALGVNKSIIIDTTPPSPFTIDSPVSAATLSDHTPEISWSDPTDASHYTVLIDDTSGCVSPEQTFNNVVALTQVSGSLTDGTWYVCVAAVDDAGNSTSATNNDLTFTLNTGAWTATTTLAAPTGRGGHSAVWDSVQSKMIVWGGFDGTNQLATGGVYDPVGDVWSPTDIADIDLPEERQEHSTVWSGSQMIVWGGFNTVNDELDNGGKFNPGTDDWEAVTTTSAPVERRRHSAIWNGTAMIIWGGSDNGTALNTGGQYDPALDSWTQTDVADGDLPAAREEHTAVWSGTYMIVWGGTNGTAMNSGGRFDPAGPDYWLPMTTTGAPSARLHHIALWTGTRMVVFGGYDGVGTYLNDGGIYDPATDSWTPVSSTEAPSVRSQHAGVWDSVNSRMYLFAGYNGAALGGGAGFDAVGNAWTVPALNTAAAPAARYGHSTVFSGTHMIIWGGYGGLDDGGKYAPP